MNTIQKTVQLRNTVKDDFMGWLKNELTRPAYHDLFNSFLATDEEGREYTVTLQTPYFNEAETLIVEATSKTEDGMGVWGSVMKFKCLQLTTDTCQLNAEYIQLPGIEEYFNALWEKVLENFLDEITPADNLGNFSEDIYIFKKEGEGWVLRFEGELKTFSDLIGFEYIQTLLKVPGQEVSALDLETGKSRGIASRGTDKAAGYILGEYTETLSQQYDYHYMADRDTIMAVRKRINDLELELADRRENGGETISIEEELEKCKKYYDAVRTKGFYQRTFPDDLEKSRQRVSSCIRTVYKKLENNMPSLLSHLRNNISMGKWFFYRSTGINKWKT